MSGTIPRQKALPQRPMQDLGYVSAPPNGTRGPPELSGRTVLEGYRSNTTNGFEEKPRYNPLNPTRPQSSPLLNVNDPIQVHLLVETALCDSKEYEILSPEEVDDLQKQCQALTQRIEQTRQGLALQSKYRDAAISMAKLYTNPDKKKSMDGQDGKRRSIFGHNRNVSDSVKEADQERMASEKKCEDLALELWNLEKRQMELQSRLLKHTAGILQMTHKGPKVPMVKGGAQQQGIPGSPESMYTYSNARSSMEPLSDDLFFDERSFYRLADHSDEFEIGGREGFMSQSKGSSKEQMQMIANTERKLEDLNRQLREVIVRANPDRETTYSAPPGDGNSADAGASLQSHLDYMEKSIMTINQGNGGQAQSAGAELSKASTTANRNMGNQGNSEQMETVLMGLWDIIQSGEEDHRQRKADRRKTRMAQNLPEDEDDSPDDDSDPNEKFSLQGFSSKVQWLYTQATRLKDQKKVLQRQIKQQRELNNKSDATKDAEMEQKIEELRRTQDLLTRSEADADNVRQQLSDMMERLAEKDQQQLLRDQARSNGDSAVLKQSQEELNSSNQKLQKVEQELESRIQTIRQVEEQLESRNVRIASLEEELETRNQRISALEKELQDMKDGQTIGNAELQGKITSLESKIASLTQELAAAQAAQALFENSSQEKQKVIDAKEQEKEEMNMEIANLRTEVTIARAELDGAYGSRAQRAAEVAANPEIQREIDALTKSNSSLAAELATLLDKGTANPEAEAKMATLKKELEETIEEYEQMTKASIEWEKERESLEGTIDNLRDERDSLETQLSDEKVRWLGMKSPGIDGTLPPGSTSTSVLKDEFKKMMRDARAENAKALRAEQAERRRLEDELRALKKTQGPGRSGLSQSMGT
ncbi:uncharacterized protein L3040_000923 [Drepanopeziza brunnea f. sp. 'multigermtubi']|uniref:Involucrin repeat protein n=1 Tax=Marssonina brunnea f. sp. multigermtubi (strain MB_m1) TaxID=1072389 RepID=K1XJE7_MARBU|nr:involucrin repeat protein [Drepanopeziza brunnea f. sp. 'multigermtubi' MB_m1]EKD20818.1 involucrin repeat protein [Drepanopeziza brunnea f. sp. 'multigermtubi' MB_m1]KAJ5054657.1 hypothetical protein L3040_000923 [Drepanopeziza brunnea f. sp. 'multigermtubi']